MVLRLIDMNFLCAVILSTTVLGVTCTAAESKENANLPVTRNSRSMPLVIPGFSKSATGLEARAPDRGAPGKTAPQVRLESKLPVPTTSSDPKPGVYKTMPYTCIVIVPGGHPDDGIFLRPSGPISPMPSIKPDLQFIPRRP